jgi:hypothetical protein
MSGNERLTARQQIEASLSDLNRQEEEHEAEFAKAEREFAATMAETRAAVHAGIAQARAEMQQALQALENG